MSKLYEEKTEDYYLKAYAIGPKLPPVLYGLADLYASNGDVAKFKPVAEAILANWPDDKQMRGARDRSQTSTCALQPL